MMLRARVVLPLDSGPKTPMTRPRGMPPPRMPSTVRQPVELRSLHACVRHRHFGAACMGVGTPCGRFLEIRMLGAGLEVCMHAVLGVDRGPPEHHGGRRRQEQNMKLWLFAGCCSPGQSRS